MADYEKLSKYIADVNIAESLDEDKLHYYWERRFPRL